MFQMSTAVIFAHKGLSALLFKIIISIINNDEIRFQKVFSNTCLTFGITARYGLTTPQQAHALVSRMYLLMLNWGLNLIPLPSTTFLFTFPP